MKSLLLAALLFSPVASFASAIGCPTTIQIAVTQKLVDEGSTETIRSVTPVESPFSELSVYLVSTGVDYPAGIVGIPYATTYLVVTRKGPMSTCSVESVVKDLQAQ